MFIGVILFFDILLSVKKKICGTMNKAYFKYPLKF